MQFFIEVINSYPDQISIALPNLMASLISLTHSSLLQNNTLNAALELFVALVKSPLPNKLTFEVLFFIFFFKIILGYFGQTFATCLQYKSIK